MAKGFHSTIWDGMKQLILYRGLQAKFTQNIELQQLLVETGNSYLVECAHSDCIWACGIRLSEPERCDINKWKGKNLLGFSLMEIRNSLNPSRTTNE